MKNSLLQPERYNTSIAGWSFALCDALDSYGIDGHRVFQNVGIDLKKVDSPAARLPVNRVQQVWRFADENTDDFFGIQVSEFLAPSSLHALGFGLWCSSSLKDLFERYIRYRCVLSHMHFCELIETADGYSLNLVDERNIKTEITQDAAAGLFLRIARQLYDPGFAPKAVHITRSIANDVDRFIDFYGSYLTAESDSYSLIFDKEAINAKLRFANPALAAQQDAIVERYISEHGLISEYMLQVRTEILTQLGEGTVGIEQIADKMSVTVRTLQRRLASENRTYNELLEEARKQLALDYAKDQSIGATDAAFRLGFNDSSSFGRNFKRWTGKSFTAYRSSHLNKKGI